MKLSVVMMIKNEAKYLDNCLMSIKPVQAVVDTEIIIVDTGSEDNSIEIAGRYTDRIYFHKWNNDFAAMRNITIGYAKGEWVLVLDGDEAVEEPNELIDFFQSDKSNIYKTGIFPIKNFADVEKKKFALAAIPRLFRKEKGLKFFGAIHEQANITEPYYYFKSNILHYGYNTTDPELVEKKFNRNTRILLNELRKAPDNIYYWYQLAQTYAAHGDREEALEADLKAYELTKKTNNRKNYMNVYHHLAITYSKFKKYPELEQLCLEAIRLKEGYIDLYYFLAMAQKEQNKNVDAIRHFEIYLDMAGRYEDFEGSKDISVTSSTISLVEQAYADLCVLYFKEKQYESVLKCKKELMNQELLIYSLPCIVSSYIELMEYSELKEFFETEILTAGERLTNNFTNVLEVEMATLSNKNKALLIEIFSKGNSVYPLLCSIRRESKLNDSCFNDAYIARLEGVDFNKLPIYYGDIFYYLIKHNRLDIGTLGYLNNKALEAFFGYLVMRYKKECVDYILNYLEEAKIDTLNNIRIRKTLGKVLLQSEMVAGEIYGQVFNQYIEDGIRYINLLYKDNVIISEQIYDLKNEEEIMLLYMDRAEASKTKDKAECLRYLKKALDIYPAMAAGIGLYLKRLESELNEYNVAFKENIKLMIDDGNLLRAHKLIYEYEKLYKGDVEIISMKAVVAIMENHLKEAEAILKEGLLIDPENPDLLYNLEYIKNR